MSLRKVKYNQCIQVDIIIKPPKKIDGDSKTKDDESVVCSICCESCTNIKYINCKLGGVQTVNFGKHGASCKDKPICYECRNRCRTSCPFCCNHKLFNIKRERYAKKKLPFAEREKIRIAKLLKKMSKKKKGKAAVFKSTVALLQLRNILNTY